MSQKTEAAWLLDVNALIALLDKEHVHHEAMHRWFADHAAEGWATCPMTENGLVRVLAQAAYPSGQRKPAEGIRFLRELKESHRGFHHFWADEISLTDHRRFRATYLTSPRQIMDAYLLALAAVHGARLVSFDRALPWQAIHEGSARLVELPE